MYGFSNIPSVYAPFGIEDVNKMFPITGTSFVRNSKLYNLYGLTEDLASPGGSRITRHHMNGIGFLATLGAYLQQIGYQPGFDHQPTGGWPKGAIVTDTTDGAVREYVSLEENNESPVGGSYVEDGIINNEYLKSVGWKSVWDYNMFNFFPNYDDRTSVFSTTLKSGDKLESTKISADRGWFLVSRTIDGWDEMTEEEKSNLFTSAFEVYVRIRGFNDSTWNDYGDGSYLTNSLYAFEGKTAQRLLPCNGYITITSDTLSSLVASPVTINVYKFGMEDFK